MFIADDSDRIRELAGQAFAGPRDERPSHEDQLCQLACSPGPLDAGRVALHRTGLVFDAVQATVAAYLDDRQARIAYQRAAGMVVHDELDGPETPSQERRRNLAQHAPSLLRILEAADVGQVTPDEAAERYRVWASRQ